MPTGSGKTFTAVNWLLTKGVANGYRVVWLVHRKELVEQTFQEFRKLSPLLKGTGIKKLRVFAVSGDHLRMANAARAEVYVCSIASVANRYGYRFIERMVGAQGKRKLIIVVDEAHHAVAASYQMVIKRMTSLNPNRILLGLTATPTRMQESEKYRLQKMFNVDENIKNHIGQHGYIYEITLQKLIQSGFLANPIYEKINTEIVGKIEYNLTPEDEAFFSKFGELSARLMERIGRSAVRNKKIVTLNYDIGTLYVQNPPRRVVESLRAGYGDDIEYHESEYPQLTREVLKKVYSAISEDVLGQEECKRQIISGMYRLTTGVSKKPVVLMLYGPSGVGKTESAKSISKALGGELLRVQFSMMQTDEAYNYVFGSEHSKSSFARDMIGRESNVILIDEFDKVNPLFYNAFYELFDEGKYVDTNYNVNLGQAVFLLTCNFSNEAEIKKVLGPAMFSRIGCCIEFSDLTTEQKQEIVLRWYDSILFSLKPDERSYVISTNIKEWFLKNAERYDNIRILKSKLENAVFEKLTDHFIIC